MKGRPLLIVNADPQKPDFYNVLLQWVQREHPEVANLIDRQDLANARLSGDVKTCVLWAQDPMELLWPYGFEAASKLENECAARGIPVVNPVSKHSRLGRAEFASALENLGIRTPRVIPVSSSGDLCRLCKDANGRVLLCENRGHQRAMRVIESPPDAAAVSLSEYKEPVLCEFVETRHASDGLYRKYRTVACEERCVSHHLQISEHWMTRGNQRIDSLATREEEISFLIEPDPRAGALLRVRKEMEIAFLAFDYGIDVDGRPVIWEANQYPHLHLSRFNLVYRNFAIERTFAAMICMYLERAEIEPSRKLVRQCSYE